MPLHNIYDILLLTLRLYSSHVLCKVNEFLLVQLLLFATVKMYESTSSLLTYGKKCVLFVLTLYQEYKTVQPTRQMPEPPVCKSLIFPIIYLPFATASMINKLVIMLFSYMAVASSLVQALFSY